MNTKSHPELYVEVRGTWFNDSGVRRFDGPTMCEHIPMTKPGAGGPVYVIKRHDGRQTTNDDHAAIAACRTCRPWCAPDNLLKSTK